MTNVRITGKRETVVSKKIVLGKMRDGTILNHFSGWKGVMRPHSSLIGDDMPPVSEAMFRWLLNNGILVEVKPPVDDFRPYDRFYSLSDDGRLLAERYGVNA